MSARTDMIASVAFATDKPTVLPLSELAHWVVWQFPQYKGRALRGAVHPPLPDHGWIPAAIHARRSEVTVHAHLDQRYATPELAAEAI